MARVRVTLSGEKREEKHEVMKIHLPEICRFKFQAPYSRAALLIIEQLKALEAAQKPTKSKKKAA